MGARSADKMKHVKLTFLSVELSKKVFYNIIIQSKKQCAVGNEVDLKLLTVVTTSN